MSSLTGWPRRQTSHRSRVCRRFRQGRKWTDSFSRCFSLRNDVALLLPEHPVTKSLVTTLSPGIADAFHFLTWFTGLLIAGARAVIRGNALPRTDRKEEACRHDGRSAHRSRTD